MLANVVHRPDQISAPRIRDHSQIPLKKRQFLLHTRSSKYLSISARVTKASNLGRKRHSTSPIEQEMLLDHFGLRIGYYQLELEVAFVQH